MRKEDGAFPLVFSMHTKEKPEVVSQTSKTVDHGPRIWRVGERGGGKSEGEGGDCGKDEE